MGILLAMSLMFSNVSGAAVEWMWGSGERLIASDEVFRRTFEIESLPEKDVELRVLGDFCGFEVVLNGRSVLRGEPYDPVAQVSVKRWLRSGRNEILVRAHGVAGPSAIVLEVVDDGSGAPLVTSGQGWEGAVSMGGLASLRLEDPGPTDIGALDEYNQWKEAQGGLGEAAFSALPQGFRLECLRSAGRDEGSWISMAFDPQGRLIISKEKRGLCRLDPEAGEGAKLESIDDTLLECRGLLFAHGNLYANANNSLGLYRLRDTTGDDRFDDVQLLIKTEGGVGHGRNDLALGPDGLIYSIQGDSVSLPSDVFRRMPPLRDGQGEQGYLARFDAEGKQRELVAIGLRNPYGIAFNPEGEAFTYDADNEGDIGLPLYRPARVNHLVSGANYGWQQGRGESWPVYSPDSLPTTLDAGRGSPTALVFGTRSHFPERYREALFMLDWAYGRILVVDVIPEGASYRCQSETFLRGRPLNVTDLAFGPDGALYFITGGRGTQSALYRIRYDGDAIAGRGQGAQEKARIAFSKDAVALRKRLERFHGKEDPNAIKEAWAHLGSPDPWIRNAARLAIESQPLDSWSARARGPETNLTALLALARCGQDAVAKALTYDFAPLVRYEKLTVLRILELGLAGALQAERKADIQAFLSPRFPDGDASVDRELSKLLVSLGDPIAVENSLVLLSAAESQFERLHYLDVLSGAREGWTNEGRQVFFNAIRYPGYFSGDSNLPGYLKRIRDRALAGLSEEERNALGPLLEPASEMPEPPPPVVPRTLVQHWTVEDLVGAPPEGYRRDVLRGRMIFEQALCVRCHQAKGIGTAVGPNLTAVAARFSRRDLVEAIVDPSRAMAEIYRNLVIRKRDGSSVVGRVVRDDFRESTISISSNPFAPGDLTVIAKGDIVAHESSPISPMPPGLLDSFSKEEVSQLLDFLAGDR
jgi:putative heme-binding domain-containing protein